MLLFLGDATLNAREREVGSSPSLSQTTFATS